MDKTSYFLGLLTIITICLYIFLKKKGHLLIRMGKRAQYGVCLSLLGGLLSVVTLIVNFDVVGGVFRLLISWFFAMGLAICPIFGAIIACNRYKDVGGWLAIIPSLLYIISTPLMFVLSESYLYDLLFVPGHFPSLWLVLSLVGGILLLTAGEAIVKGEEE